MHALSCFSDACLEDSPISAETVPTSDIATPFKSLPNSESSTQEKLEQYTDQSTTTELSNFIFRNIDLASSSTPLQSTIALTYTQAPTLHMELPTSSYLETSTNTPTHLPMITPYTHTAQVSNRYSDIKAPFPNTLTPSLWMLPTDPPTPTQ